MARKARTALLERKAHETTHLATFKQNRESAAAPDLHGAGAPMNFQPASTKPLRDRCLVLGCRGYACVAHAPRLLSGARVANAKLLGTNVCTCDQTPFDPD